MSSKNIPEPLFVFELTTECNSNCIFCYNVWKDPQNDRQQAQECLPLSDFKQLMNNLITDLERQGRRPGSIALAGGEPLLHPDILAIAEYISQKNIPVNLATNGILLSPENILTLKGLGVRFFEISLPHISQEGYKKLTGSNEVQNIRETILTLKELHPKAGVTVAITLTKKNYSSIGDIIDLAAAFSVDRIVLNRFIPGGEGLRNTKELLLTKEELRQALIQANLKATLYALPIAVTIPVEHCMLSHDAFPNLQFGSCHCGKNKWVVDPQGNLRICEQSPTVLGSLLEKSFSELSTMEEVTQFRTQDLCIRCKKCPDNNRCGGGCRFLHEYS